MFFFFFKQKTAYEISVRDWSSDVCSSDLGAGATLCPAGGPGRTTGGGTGVFTTAGDRKSVVEGKSVNACVDLGGGRIIKKKERRMEGVVMGLDVGKRVVDEKIGR